MNLIKKRVSYKSSKDGSIEYGDLYKAIPQELYNSSILDCVIVRCNECNEIVTYCKEIYDFRLNEKKGYCFCPACAKILFNI